MALIEKLEAIGDAIRAKTGGTELLTLDAMPQEIAAIETGGGGGDIPEEAFNITGNCKYRMSNDGLNWFIENYANKITTKDITASDFMFYSSDELEAIPLEMNYKSGSNDKITISYMFAYCSNLKQLPAMNNVRIDSCDNLFYNCLSIREIPEAFYKNFDFSYMESQTSAYSCSQSNMFSNCASLRKVPLEMVASGNKKTGHSYCYLNGMCTSCAVLDELRDLPLFFTGEWTSNALAATASNCNRLKELTFELDDNGSPKVMKWKNQTLDLTRYVGYSSDTNVFTRYNTGITADYLVNDDASYQALKNTDDWFTNYGNYSRYNHDSAVNTINSLPDTSAYLATAGGTNTIKFFGLSGAKTDGGAINTLTAEEIAVATAKGWTVSL